MKIRIIHRLKLDVKKYNQCIARATKPMPYAFSQYLDTVSKNWKVVVSNDYETVMPFAVNRKMLGIPQIYQPPYTQQLGVFGRYDRDVVVVKACLDALSKFYVKVNIQLNAANPQPNIKNWSFRKRTNFILDLNDTYAALFKNFRKGHRANIKSAQSKNTIERGTLSAQEFVDFLLAQKVEIGFAKLAELISLFDSDAIWLARLTDGSIGALGFFPTLNQFMEGDNRIVYLIGHSTNAGRKAFSSHFLLANVIEHYAGQGGVFDFEGSELRGVAEFFKGFRPVVDDYLFGSR